MNEQMKEHFNASLQNSYNPAYTLHHKNECRVACIVYILPSRLLKKF